MAEERVFLNDSNVYVSNTKVVLAGTTYATANITSVSKRVTPASKGCAIIIIVFGALFVLGALGSFKSEQAGASLGMLLFAALILAVGVLWLRSLKPTFHVVLASSSGERQGLNSQDEPLVDSVIAAITDAIVHRG
jgi:RsiW-degrading membrane proteinase PrsW (M82 family)